jgi:hypothetical protein
MKTLMVSIVLILVTLPFLARAGETKHRHTENFGKSNIIYVDVSISQPNVYDCYTSSDPYLIINEDWLKVYPNPNDGDFNLEISRAKAGDRIAINIFSINGQKVYSTSENATTESLTIKLSLSALPKGIYLINVQLEQKTITRKLTII